MSAPPLAHNDPSRIKIHDAATVIADRSPDFYNKNTFEIDDPEVGLQWLTNLGLRKADMIRKIYVFLPANDYCHFYRDPEKPDKRPNGFAWNEFIKVLATETRYLEELTVYNDCEPLSCDYQYGAAEDRNFVRSLGWVSLLENLWKFELKGYFIKEWPQFLKKNTGHTVWTEEGQDPTYLEDLREFQSRFKDQEIDYLVAPPKPTWTKS